MSYLKGNMETAVESRENLESFFGKLDEDNQVKSHNLRSKVLRVELEDFFTFVIGEDESVKLGKKNDKINYVLSSIR